QVFPILCGSVESVLGCHSLRIRWVTQLIRCPENDRQTCRTIRACLPCGAVGIISVFALEVINLVQTLTCRVNTLRLNAFSQRRLAARDITILILIKSELMSLRLRGL